MTIIMTFDSDPNFKQSNMRLLASTHCGFPLSHIRQSIELLKIRLGIINVVRIEFTGGRDRDDIFIVIVVDSFR
jgi:hypothetical protein